MAGHTEIIAIQSTGVSFRRLLLPYFIAAMVIGMISFALNGWVIPKSTKSRLAFELQYFNNRYYFEARNIHLQIAPNVYLFIQNYNNVSNVGYQFSLERFNKNELIEKLSADNIRWDSVKQKWTIKNWKRRSISSIFTKKAGEDLSGIIGVITGVLLALLAGAVSPLPTAVSLPGVVLGIVMSAGIGVFFGSYPAWRAARLDPIEALRYE